MGSDEHTVSERLFERQIEVTEKLASVAHENAAATRGIAETQLQQGRLIERLEERNQIGRSDLEEHMTKGMQNLEAHITAEVMKVGDKIANKMEFYNKPQFWLAIILLAASSAAGAVMKYLDKG